MKNLYPIHLTSLVLYIILVGLLSGCNKPEERKNVLFILSDDFGYYDIGFRGSTFYETPNIDTMASNSIVFNQGYANSGVCSPSRASIMNGQFTARHGITDWIGALSGTSWRTKGRFNKLLPSEYIKGLPHSQLTIAEVLKQNGYHTFFAGKWHLGENGSLPEDHGFDINIGGTGAGSPNGGYFSPFNNPKIKDQKAGENLSMRLAEETISFMEQNKNKSFFAFLSFYAVHGPVQTTQQKWQKYQRKAVTTGVAKNGFKKGHFLPQRIVQDNPIYGGLVENMDDAVGRVLNSLREMGLDQNTLVIFTSDNGGVNSGDNYSTTNLPLRGGKGHSYEGGIKVPFLIKVPWLSGAISASNTPVTGADLYPTILDLLDLDQQPEHHLDGISLKPVILGAELPDRPLIWHYPHYGNQGGKPSSILRKGNWKLIRFYEDNREELYNLDIDSSETRDLAYEYPEHITRLGMELSEYLKKVGASYPLPDPSYQKEVEAAYLDKMVPETLKILEEQRLKILMPDFTPNEDWWGSQVTHKKFNNDQLRVN